ncbi:hypothetical protein CCP3SC15_6590001 [Gammaproteobacteria bacterium]
MIITNKQLAQVSLAQAATGYTESTKMNRFYGQATCLLTVAGAGTVTITQQLSLTGEPGTWYDPVDEDGTAAGEMANAVTAGTTWRIWSIRLAPWIRFKCVEANAGTATVDINFAFQESLE